jgi:hypothetical protein
VTGSHAERADAGRRGHRPITASSVPATGSGCAWSPAAAGPDLLGRIDGPAILIRPRTTRAGRCDSPVNLGGIGAPAGLTAHFERNSAGQRGGRGSAPPLPANPVTARHGRPVTHRRHRPYRAGAHETPYREATTDGRSTGRPASTDRARRTYCASAQASGAAEPVAPPKVKPYWFARSQTCSGMR